MGKSPSHVRRRLKLCDLLPDTRKAFFAGKLTALTADLLARLPNPEDQAKALAYAMNGIRNGEPMPANEVRHCIERNFMLLLANAPSDRKDAGLVPGAGACGPCPERTGNQGDLLGDVKNKDVCTDPACFQAKTQAAYTRAAEDALQKGYEVLSEEESLKLFPHGGYLALNFGYVDLAERNLQDPEGRTWRQLLRKNVPPITVAKDSFKLHHLVHRKDALAALEAAGYAFMAKAGKSSTLGRLDDAECQRREAMARERMKRQAALAAMVSPSPPSPRWDSGGCCCPASSRAPGTRPSGTSSTGVT